MHASRKFLPLFSLTLSLSACGPVPGSSDSLSTPSARPSATQTAAPVKTPAPSPSALSTPTPLPTAVSPRPGSSATPAPLPSDEPSTSPIAGCSVAPVLKEEALPKGLMLPAGMQARLFTTPYPVGDVFFDDAGVAHVFSLDRQQQQITSTDPCGSWTTVYRHEVLAGINGKGAVPLKTGGILTAIDYWPDGGNNYRGLMRLQPDSNPQPQKLNLSHDGTQDILRLPRTDLLTPAKLTGIEIPEGTQIQVLRSSYLLGPLGSPFYGPDGSLYVASSSLQRMSLLKLSPLGQAQILHQHELLRGPIWRHGAVVDGLPVLTMDYAPAAGVQTRGIYAFNEDGSVQEWSTSQSHDGLHDILAAPQGGIWFTDFENDNVWYKKDASTPETALLDPSLAEIPGALASLAYDSLNDTLFFLNRIETGSWWGSGPGVRGIYKVGAGIAELYAEAPEGRDLDGLAYTDRGPLGPGLFTLERQTGHVLKVRADGSLIPVVKGLPNPSELRFDPVTGTLTVVCDGQYLVQIGSSLPLLQKEDEPSTDQGWFFSDFENDNVWLLQAGSESETALLEGEIPPGLFSLAWLEASQELYALNRSGNWPFGGSAGLYRLHPNGRSEQVVKARENSNFGGLTSGRGHFDPALYWTDPDQNQIWTGFPSLSPRVYLAGIPQPSYLDISPQGDRMLVVLKEGQQLLWLGPRLDSP